MVKGLALFKEHFAPYKDQYILIGGTACMLVMEEAGIPFRSTQDLDIVLCVEALDKEFVSAFKEFVKLGGYQHQQLSTGKDIFYRFTSPKNKDFPTILELFSRRPDMVRIDFGGHITPIPVNESMVSLSALLLDDTYYHFIRDAKLEVNGLTTIGAPHLIPLKAKAWLDLSHRRITGEGSVDGKDVKKHLYDIFRLFQLLTLDDSIHLPQSIKNDLQEFILRIENEPVDLKSLGLKRTTHKKVVDSLKTIYNIATEHVPV